MDDHSGMSFRERYRLADQGRTLLESSASSTSSAAYQVALLDVLANYSACAHAISAISLFSTNESLDDLATADLPYLLLDHHVAVLLDRLSTTTPQDRLLTLSRSRTAHDTFLARVDAYSLLTPHHAALYSRYTEDPTGFSTTVSADASSRRDAKIAAFRHERTLKQRLETLMRNPRYLEEGGDEEIVRETHLAALQLAVHSTFQALEALAREQDLLAHIPSTPLQPPTPDDRRHRPASGTYSDRLDDPLSSLNPLGRRGPILDHTGKPLKPFTLVSARQDVTAGVFRPSHNLPTMSIDEYLAEERRRGGMIEGGGEASGKIVELDEDDYERGEEETMKQRRWDDFTEENAKGWGNTLNKG